MRIRVSVLGCVAMVCGVLLGTGSAFAAVDTGWFAAHDTEDQHAIVDYVYERSGHDVPYSGDAEATADAIAESVMDSGSHEFPLAAEIAAEEFGAAEGVGLLAPFEAMAPFALAAGGTFIVGLTIGTGLRRLFASFAAPADSAVDGPSPPTAVYWREHGFDFFYGATVQQNPGAYLYFDGSNYIRWWDLPCSYSGFTPPAGARMQTGVSTETECLEWVEDHNEHYPIVANYPYLLPGDFRPQEPLRPYDWETDAATGWDESPPDPGTSTVTPGLSLLDGDGYDLLRAELEWGLTPGAQTKEEPIRAGVDLSSEDQACKSYFSEAPGTDPGARAPLADSEAADWDYDFDQYSSVYNPLIDASQTVKLRWGTRAWGYRHIALGHGWDIGAAARTQLALQTDTAPTTSERDPSEESFVYLYNIPSLPNNMHCRQRVIVSYRTDGPYVSGRHIITSYLEAY